MIEIIKPGTRAKTVIGGIEGFISAAKIMDCGICYEFSYFNGDGYRQQYLDLYELEIDNAEKIKIGFKK